MTDVVTGYLSMIDGQLPGIVERLRRVRIVCRPAIDVIQSWDAPGSLFCCDPPYQHDTRAGGSRDIHGHEMVEFEHRVLAAVLNVCKGKVILSGYPSPLYEELYGSRRTVKIDIANHAAGGKMKARMEEVLWSNWDTGGCRLPSMSLRHRKVREMKGQEGRASEGVVVFEIRVLLAE